MTSFQTLALVTGLAYLVRDGFAAVWRWLLDLSGAPLLWFAVDLLGLAAFLVFVHEFAVRRSLPFAVYLVALLGSSTLIAGLTLGAGPVFLFAAVKMVIPLYAGLMLADCDIGASQPVRRLILGVAILSAVGILLDLFVDFPWAGMSLQQFGVAKTVDKVWWIQSAARFSGFSGESTTSAIVCLFAWLLVYRHLSAAANLAMVALIVCAAIVATSRTALGVSLIAGAYILGAAWFSQSLRSLSVHRRFALVSLGMAVVPLILIGLSQSVRFDEISTTFLSLQQRIDESWRYPFRLLAEKSPGSLVFGCGLGCLTSPARYSEWAALVRPIDNFYVASWVMFGMSFLPVFAMTIIAALRETRCGKLLLLAAFNAAGVTLDGYSPTFLVFVIGYAISEGCLTRFGLREFDPARQSSPAIQSP